MLVLLVTSKDAVWIRFRFWILAKNTKVYIFTFIKLSTDITDYRGDGFISN